MRRLAALPVALAISAVSLAQPAPPAALRAAVADTFVVPEVAASKKVPPAQSRRVLDAAARDFDRQLDAIADSMTPAAAAQAIAHESDSIEAKLAAIAADRKARPAVYAEIFGTYVAPSELLSQSGRPPAPSRAHATEPFRLAWEYVLLRPRSSDTAARYEDGAADAVGQIGNPKSIVTLVHLVRVSTQPGARIDFAETRQRASLRGLIGIPTAEAAAAIGQSLRMIAAQQQAPRLDWNRFVVMAIDELPPAKRVQWRDLAQRLKPEAPETRRFLNDVRTRPRPEVK